MAKVPRKKPKLLSKKILNARKAFHLFCAYRLKADQVVQAYNNAKPQSLPQHAI